ncbi:LPXTG cell wall anchor domain-containing protein [Oceanobacillus sp. CAU 1775]
MKKEKNILYIIALFSFLFVGFLILPNHVEADDATEEIVIDRFPSEELFYVENAKPGDYAYRPLLIQNNHDIDILYSMHIRNDGETKLFDELLLQVTFFDEIVFDGKLKDYEGYTDYPIGANKEVETGFKLMFPAELGNEFQNKKAEFTLVFQAVAKEAPSFVGGISTEVGSGDSSTVKGISTNEGSTLPKTATNIFTYILIGGLLIALGASVSYLSKRENAFPLAFSKIKSFIKFKY